MQQILTAADVIDYLGGNQVCAKLFGVKYNNVTNWRLFGHFPPDTYVMIQDELKQRNLVAPDYLWKMRSRAKPRKTPKRKPKASAE